MPELLQLKPRSPTSQKRPNCCFFLLDWSKYPPSNLPSFSLSIVTEHKINYVVFICISLSLVLLLLYLSSFSFLWFSFFSFVVQSLRLWQLPVAVATEALSSTASCQTTIKTNSILMRIKTFGFLAFVVLYLCMYECLVLLYLLKCYSYTLTLFLGFDHWYFQHGMHASVLHARRLWDDPGNRDIHVAWTALPNLWILRFIASSFKRGTS